MGAVEFLTSLGSRQASAHRVVSDQCDGDLPDMKVVLQVVAEQLKNTIDTSLHWQKTSEVNVYVNGRTT